MKLLSLLSIVLLLIFTRGHSQVTDMGGPLSWNGKVPAATLPLQVMPSFDMALQLYEDSISNSLKGGPWRFGFNHYVDFDLGNSGVWTTLPNGDRIWRINIASKGALTINLIFEEFDLPDGAYVYLSDKNQSNRVGAYTSRNNNPEQKLGTELVHGDNIIVEYFEPQAVIGQGILKIGTVTHGYKELGSYADKLGNDLITKALNSSGDCNVDVNCPLGIGWEDQIRSVAMIVVGGNGICTGALINNVSCDFTPYFLTANHCYSGSIATWSFRFNWESPPGTESCATTANSVDPGAPYDQTSNGGIVRANDSGSDFLLLEMNMSVAEAETWNVFFAGWDNTETIPTQVTGIHHPSGDVKKICQDDGAVFDTWNFNGDPNTMVWRVNDWTSGVTEPGSSGSPLFDQNGRIIGDLSGGSAQCFGTSAAGFDGYGRFGIAWNGGGTPATRVRDWLDPANTSTTNDGCDPNAPTAADDIGINGIITPDGIICMASFDPEVTLRNFGSNTVTSATIIYDIDGGVSQIFNWTGSLAVGATVNVVLPTMASTNGAHTFNAASSLPNGVADADASNDGTSNPFVLVIGGESVDFTLDLDCWGTEITWTVQQGATLLYSGGPYTEVTPGGAGQITETWCLSAGCYDFTINDSYGDGMYGSQYGSCNVDGNYSIDQGTTQLATMIATNSDFVNQEINNFCVTSSVTVADFSATPTIVCPGTSVTYTDLSTGSPTSWSWTFPGGTPATSTAQNPTIVYNTIGSYDVTLLATGSGSDTEIKTNYIVVGDAIAPTAVCQNINVYLDGSGNASIVAADIDGGSTDNCGAVTLSVSSSAFTCANLGPNPVVLTVTDASGNTNTCTSTVTVSDTTSPVISCPGNQVENPDTFCSFILPDYTALVNATDNCGTATVIQSPAAGTVISGTTTLTMTSTDDSGNTSSCTFQVILTDGVAPIAVCQDINIYLDATGNASIVGADLDGGSTDNCSVLTFSASQTAFTCADLGTVNVILTVSDGSSSSSNCVAIVTVIDTISPVLPGLADVTGDCSATAIIATTTDNCSGTITGTTTDPLIYSAQGNYTINWTFDDGNGNTSTQTQNVIVNGIDVTTTLDVDGVTISSNNTAATNYIWINCIDDTQIPGETNVDFIATAVGDYAVIVTEENCTDTSNCVNVNILGLEDIIFEDFILYPNPTADGMFTISYEGVIQKIDVVDMLGRLISLPVNLETNVIDGSELANGKYMVRLYTESKTILQQEVVVIK